MIILTAGHTGPQTGAHGVQIENVGRLDEGSETIALRNRIAEILTEQYGITVMTDGDTEKLGVLVQRINKNVSNESLCIDIHLNSSTNPDANGTEVIVGNDASEYEINVAVRLLNSTAKALQTNIRGVKTESETPKKRLAMLHLDCNSVILEVCFCSNKEDSRKYMKMKEKVAQALAETIAHNIL